MVCSTKRISTTNADKFSKSKFSPLAQVGPLLQGQVLLEVRADQEGPRKHRTLRSDYTLRDMKGLETGSGWATPHTIEMLIAEEAFADKCLAWWIDRGRQTEGLKEQIFVLTMGPG